MKRLLIKQGKTNKEFIELEVDNHLLRRTFGKIGLSAAKKTSHCGTHEKAIQEAEEIANEYKRKGFIEEEPSAERAEPIIYDNAAWHYGGDFPNELDSYQAYVHTGFYVGWLIKKKLFSDNFMKENDTGIKTFLKREITSPTFFKEFMDGKFLSSDLSDEGAKFTIEYFNIDFGESKYVEDLIQHICNNLPTIYHTMDSWNNFDTIAAVVDLRFNDWKYKQTESNKA